MAASPLSARENAGRARAGRSMKDSFRDVVRAIDPLKNTPKGQRGSAHPDYKPEVRPPAKPLTWDRFAAWADPLKNTPKGQRGAAVPDDYEPEPEAMAELEAASAPAPRAGARPNIPAEEPVELGTPTKARTTQVGDSATPVGTGASVPPQVVAKAQAVEPKPAPTVAKAAPTVAKAADPVVEGAKELEPKRLAELFQKATGSSYNPESKGDKEAYTALKAIANANKGLSDTQLALLWYSKLKAPSAPARSSAPAPARKPEPRRYFEEAPAPRAEPSAPPLRRRPTRPRIGGKR